MSRTAAMKSACAVGVDSGGRVQIEDRYGPPCEMARLDRSSAESHWTRAAPRREAPAVRTARRQTPASRRTRCPAHTITQAPMLGLPVCGEPVFTKDLGRTVVEDVRLHAVDDAQFVDDPPVVRQQVGDPGAALPAAREGSSRPSSVSVSLEKSKTPACQKSFRRGLSAELRELGFVLEQFQLTGTACHEQKDHRPHRPRWCGGLGARG